MEPSQRESWESFQSPLGDTPPQDPGFTDIDRWKIEQLCRQLWPDANFSSFRVRRLGYGLNNKTRTLHIVDKDGGGMDFVLRTPRPAKRVPIADAIVIHHYLRGCKRIPVPEIHFFDVTDNNPIHSPYIVMNKIRGVPLSRRIHSGITYEQRLRVAKELGEFNAKLRTLQSPRAGILRNAVNIVEDILKKNPETVIKVQPFGHHSRPQNTN